MSKASASVASTWLEGLCVCKALRVLGVGHIFDVRRSSRQLPGSEALEFLIWSKNEAMEIAIPRIWLRRGSSPPGQQRLLPGRVRVGTEKWFQPPGRALWEVIRCGLYCSLMGFAPCVVFAQDLRLPG